MRMFPSFRWPRRTRDPPGVEALFTFVEDYRKMKCDIDELMEEKRQMQTELYRLKTRVEFLERRAGGRAPSPPPPRAPTPPPPPPPPPRIKSVSATTLWRLSPRQTKREIERDTHIH